MSGLLQMRLGRLSLVAVICSAVVCPVAGCAATDAGGQPLKPTRAGAGHATHTPSRARPSPGQAEAEVADEWGRLLARAEDAGTPVGGIDGLIAATAKVHQLNVVTWNDAHFQPTGVEVLCPWQGPVGPE